MRRQLLSELPTWTKFYGFHPRDLEALTLREVIEYRRQMHEALAREGGGG